MPGIQELKPLSIVWTTEIRLPYKKGKDNYLCECKRENHAHNQNRPLLYETRAAEKGA